MTADYLFTEGMTAEEEAATDILSLRTLFVNVCFVGQPGSREWVLVDTGMTGFKEHILAVAEKRFAGPPTAIILTHGHFDHVGSVIELVQHWGVPVYAHAAELPYLTGQEDYPPADPGVGGGMMARTSFLYPNDAIDLDDQVDALPEDGEIPGMPGWRWIHTPGHTPGHVSLYREEDGALLAGDAFITVKQESAWAVLIQEKEVHGPPAYFTTDWPSAHQSVQQLCQLNPKLAVTGHGSPMRGDELRRQLKRLSEHFEEMAVPRKGKYV
ncbi:MBL fold metallo-hydrolase [Paenibacillus sp. JX-17]|uniref:MBL fold metallo-hydrolase n=1 Tax=Paenibacillus lacisoli TaxID=3064525 RepID=A0ABT9CAY6_9BACL|nr:MBL fold metallo-hydrolase [Paenibacillus sp. JX-17]MDO7904856.1 MBL fold metallo-hydrolase [Paenibacillus sp. JX-17]